MAVILHHLGREITYTRTAGALNFGTWKARLAICSGNNSEFTLQNRLLVFVPLTYNNKIGSTFGTS